MQEATVTAQEAAVAADPDTVTKAELDLCDSPVLHLRAKLLPLDLHCSHNSTYFSGGEDNT